MSRPPRPALVVFAKAPEAGRVKTRMCPPFTPEQARDLYACMLDDVLEVSRAAVQRLGIEAVLAVTPEEAVESLAERAPDFAARPQRGPDLGARMEGIVEELAGEGFGPILLRGSDSPCLGTAQIEAALAALARAEVVVLPDLDGGYSLVGLRKPVPGFFDHPMSTGSVLRDTRARADARGLSVVQLDPGFDIDTQADLALLAEARRANPAIPCGRTLAFLDRLRLWPANA